ncbi:protein translocase subunit SecF [bacterium]|nr:protein translocase subunit SecF [bacterium]
MFQLNLVKYRFVCLAMSAVLLLPGIIAMIYSSITYPTHSPLKVGIDYTGGTVLQYGVNDEVSDLGIIRKDLAKADVENPYLQIINANSESAMKIKSIISIKTKFIDEKNNKEVDKITGVIQNTYPDAQLLQVSSVGPTLGKELFKNSLIALGLAILGIIAYLSIRFQFDYALAAILGLVHDVLFTLGVFSILGLVNDVQIDGLFVTALLTVIGFSVHDTIVIFDRIRENIRYYSKKMSFSEIVNFSVNQTLTRSINTSVTTLITLLALFFLGGTTTKDFVLAMIVGIMIGTYSSIFFCTVLVDIWQEKKLAQRGAGVKA